MSDISGPYAPPPTPKDPPKRTLQHFIDASKKREGGPHVKLDPTADGGVRPGTRTGLLGKVWNLVVIRSGSLGLPIGADTRAGNWDAINAFRHALLEAYDEDYGTALPDAEVIEMVATTLRDRLPSVDGKHRLTKEAVLEANEELELAPALDPMPRNNLERVQTLERALRHFQSLDVSINLRQSRRSMLPEDATRAALERRGTEANLHSLRENPSFPTGPGEPREKVLAYGKAVVRGGSERLGNCVEIACAAAYVLEAKLNCANWSLVYYTEAGADNHVFLAVGAPDGYPDNFADWPEVCAIFDGWARIACSAQDYPQRWAETMRAWTERGIEISPPPIDLFADRAGTTMTPGDGWRSPLLWTSLVGGRKAKYTAD